MASFDAFQRTLRALRCTLGVEFFQRDESQHTDMDRCVLQAYRAMVTCVERFLEIEEWGNITPELLARMQELESAACHLHDKVRGAPEGVALVQEP